MSMADSGWLGGVDKERLGKRQIAMAAASSVFDEQSELQASGRRAGGGRGVRLPRCVCTTRKLRFQVTGNTTRGDLFFHGGKTIPNMSF